MPTSLGKGVIVEWVDARSTDAWEDADDPIVEPLRCRTRGMLIAETDNKIVVAQTVGHDGSRCGTIAIPKVCITSVKRGLQ